nr:MAG TPA: hypothetical protein [Caudoviricetes sp.]
MVSRGYEIKRTVGNNQPMSIVHVENIMENKTDCFLDSS